MSFALSRLREDVARRTHASGSDFQDHFLSAVSDVVQDIIIESVIEATAFDPDDPSTEVDVPVKYYSVVRDGVMYVLGQNKRFTVNGEVMTDARYRRSLARLKGSAMIDADVPSGMNFEID